MRASVLSVAEPFVGLRPFEKSDTHLFFGRDLQINELLSRLRTQRFVVVMGTSGSGKSSLIRAGLIPALEGGFISTVEGSWRIAVFRPGGNPIGNLAAALTRMLLPLAAESESVTERAILESILRRGSLGLVDAIRESSLAERGPLLVVVDQFEELFRFKTAQHERGAEDHAAAFVKLLLETVRHRQQPVHVVLTMRSEFLGDCSQFPDLPEFINAGLYLIPRLNRDQLAEAIIGPAAVAGARVSPSLVQRLLNDVGDDPDQLPILQHALMRMWSRLRDNPAGGQLLLEHYDEIHGLNDALSDHADEAYGELDERQRRIAENVFKSLTERSQGGRDVRRPTTLEEACNVANASSGEVVAVLEHFRREGRCFIVPSGAQPLASDVFLDISHESLIRKWKRLRDWVHDEAEDRKLFLRLADSAAAHAEGAEPLWRQPQLGLALDWRMRFQPTTAWARRHGRDLEPAIRFLDDSDKAAQSEHRRATIRRYGWIFATGALLSLGAIAWGIYDELAHAKGENIAAQKLVDLTQKLADAEKQRTINAERNLSLQTDIFKTETRAAQQRTEHSKLTAAAEAARRRDAEVLRQRLILKFNRTSNSEGSELGTLVALHAWRRAQSTGGRDVVNQARNDLRQHLALFQQLAWEDKLPSSVTRVAGATDSRVVVASTGMTLSAWDFGSPVPGRLKDLPNTEGLTAAINVGETGRFVAWISRTVSAAPAWTLSLWDSHSRKLLSETKPAFRTVRVAVPAASRPAVVLTGEEGTELWSFESRESRRLSERRVERVVFSADDRVLATAGEGRLLVWAIAPFKSITGTDLQAGTGAPVTPVSSLVVSPKGNYVAAATGNLAWVWKLPLDDNEAADAASLQVRYPVDSANERVTGLSFSPDEELVAAAGSSGRVIIMETTLAATRGSMPSRPQIRTQFMLQSPADHVVFSADGKLLASASRDGNVRIWSRDGEDWRPMARMTLRSRAQSFAFVHARDTKEIAILTGEDSTVRLWKLTESEVANLSGGALADLACSRVTRALRAEEWEAYFGTERYEPPCPGTPLLPIELLKLQIIHARNGNATAARDAFRWTGKLDQLSVSQLVTTAVVQAEAGNRAEARELFRAAARAAQAEDGDDRRGKARNNNLVCWHGAIRDFANEVLPACRTAVELASDSVRFNYRDSLGVAQALRGERDEALAAFEEYVAKAKDRPPALVARRQQWIGALKNRRNPFRDDKQRVLEELQKYESSRLADPELSGVLPTSRPR